jgi:hypothetical protein
MAARLLPNGGAIILKQSPPRLGMRISPIIADHADSGIVGQLGEAEELFFEHGIGDDDRLFYNYDAETLRAAFAPHSAGISIEEIDQSEPRLVTEKDLKLWFNTETSRWGSFIQKTIGDAAFAHIETKLRETIRTGPVRWHWRSLLVKAVIEKIA